MREVDGLQVAAWVLEENAHPATTRDWIIPRRVPYGNEAPIEGYLDKVSANQGEEITLYVNTVAQGFRAFVYRIGYYGGLGGRHIATSPELKGLRQPPPRLVAGVNMVECDWTASWQTTVGADWPPGNYLLVLRGTGDARLQRYVPFVVRDDTSHSAYLIQSSVTTWQAYNPWGGYSLYGGPAGGLATRARVVSYNRPYGHSPTALDGRGSGDFLGNELPLVFLAERHGLDVSYWTDVDLDLRPELLANHRCLVSLGHDEYWSMTMRDGVQQAISKGTNVAFLGANACYRQIRFASGHRQVICYKDAAEDPIDKTDPALATGGSWATDPVPRPESDLVGIMYQSYGAEGPLVVADAGAWVFEGTGLTNGDRIEKVLGSEFDGFEPRSPQPPGPVQILAHSKTPSVSGPGNADAAYYSVPGGGGVFATGTAKWVTSLWDASGATLNKLGLGVSSHAVAPLTKITLNVLGAFGAGPADRRHPSVENWRQFYSPRRPGSLPWTCPRCEPIRASPVPSARRGSSIPIRVRSPWSSWTNVGSLLLLPRCRGAMRTASS